MEVVSLDYVVEHEISGGRLLVTVGGDLKGVLEAV